MSRRIIKVGPSHGCPKRSPQALAGGLDDQLFQMIMGSRVPSIQHHATE